MTEWKLSKATKEQTKQDHTWRSREPEWLVKQFKYPEPRWAPITNDPPLPTGGTAPAKQRRGRDNILFTLVDKTQMYRSHTFRIYCRFEQIKMD